MNWQEKLRTFEKNKEWDNAIGLIKETVAESPNDYWAYVQAIYLFHNILLEEDYPEEKPDDLAALLQEYFELSKSKFSDNSEYLFFIGKILQIAEWYFGLDDNQLALEFQEMAMDKESGNLLYEWAYRLSCPGDTVEGYLANQLIENKDEKVEWLKTKGFPGEYILEHLKMSSERYTEKEAST